MGASSSLARLVGPFVRILDDRVTRLAERLEAHADRLGAAHDARLDALERRLAAAEARADERARLDADVLDEHLLVIERAAAQVTDAAGRVTDAPAGLDALVDELRGAPGARLVRVDGTWRLVGAGHAVPAGADAVLVPDRP